MPACDSHAEGDVGFVRDQHCGAPTAESRASECRTVGQRTASGSATSHPTWVDSWRQLVRVEAASRTWPGTSSALVLAALGVGRCQSACRVRVR